MVHYFMASRLLILMVYYGLTEISLLAIDEAAYCDAEIYNNARDRMRRF